MSTPTDPIALFHSWQREAMGASATASSLAARLEAWRVVGLRRLVAWALGEALPFADAAALGTCSTTAMPSVRMVLVKRASADGFVFYTDTSSRKGVELAENPRAALAFYWPTVERQVRVEGAVTPLARALTQAYWASRPRGSQLSATASRQSATLAARATLVARVRAHAAQYRGAPVPCPERWGGYCLRPARIEFWQGRPDRLHERILYERVGSDPARWQPTLLQP
jgi:pyridoxamine 5'-phosphate oxidase